MNIKKSHDGSVWQNQAELREQVEGSRNTDHKNCELSNSLCGCVLSRTYRESKSIARIMCLSDAVAL